MMNPLDFVHAVIAEVGLVASGGGDYSGQKKAAQLMPGIDALWTASRGESQDGSV